MAYRQHATERSIIHPSWFVQLALSCIVYSITLSPNAYADRVKLRAADGANAKDLISELQAELIDESKPETEFEARRQAKRAETIVSDLLNSKGYFDPAIEILVESNGEIRPILMLDPGPRFSISEIAIDYIDVPPREDDKLQIIKMFDEAPGKPAIPSEVITGEGKITSSLVGAGYPFAKAETRQIYGDREKATITVNYQINAGPRVRVGDVVFADDNIRTREKYLRKLVPLETGSVYAPSDFSTFSSRLDETRLFSSSIVRFDESVKDVSAEGDEVRDVIVSLTERKRNTVEAGLSLSTDKGFGLAFDFTQRNFTRRGDDLTAIADITSVEQTLSLEWDRPNQFGYGKGLVFEAALSNEDTDAYSLQSFTLGGGYEVRKNRAFTYGLGVEGEIIKEEDAFGKRDLQIISFYTSASIDQADSALNASKGWRAEVRTEPSMSFGSDDTQYIRSTGQLRGYYPLNESRNLVLAGRLRLGTIWGADIEDLPTTSRFFAGGGGSIRGFAYQAVGPRSDDNEPTGGRSLIETSLEARWRVYSKISAVSFIDAGNVSLSESPDVSNFRYGAGLGVRYDTPAGPLRVDIAVPLDKTVNDDPFHIYISLGQAF